MMTFESAIRASIRAYFKGKEPSLLRDASGKRQKYGKKYFDRFEEEEFGSKTELRKVK